VSTVENQKDLRFAYGVILPWRPVPEVVSLPLDNSDRLFLYPTKGFGYRGMYEICFAYGIKEMVMKEQKERDILIQKKGRGITLNKI
jgi:hypothetical protein